MRIGINKSNSRWTQYACACWESLKLLVPFFSAKSKTSGATGCWLSHQCWSLQFHLPSISRSWLCLSSMSGEAPWCASFGASKKQGTPFSAIASWASNSTPSLFLSLQEVQFKVSVLARCFSSAVTWTPPSGSICFLVWLQWSGLVHGCWFCFHSTSEMPAVRTQSVESQVFQIHLRFELIILL